MAILQSIINKDYYPNLPFSNVVTGNLGFPMEETFKNKHKIIFKFYIQLHYSGSRIYEDVWIRGQLDNLLELRDSSGKCFSLDNIFIEGRNHIDEPSEHGSTVVLFFGYGYCCYSK